MLTIDVWKTHAGWMWGVYASDGATVARGGPLRSRRDAQAAAAAAVADSF